MVLFFYIHLSKLLFGNEFQIILDPVLDFQNEPLLVLPQLLVVVKTFEKIGIEVEVFDGPFGVLEGLDLVENLFVGFIFREVWLMSSIDFKEMSSSELNSNRFLFVLASLRVKQVADCEAIDEKFVDEEVDKVPWGQPRDDFEQWLVIRHYLLNLFRSLALAFKLCLFHSKQLQTRNKDIFDIFPLQVLKK